MTSSSKPDEKRATIVDIARRAGVSPKTVSRVMNDEPHVKQAVREQVKAIARELNYHPNVMAQGLIARKSYLIGLTYERPSPSYVVELQRGALERLAGERYRLIVLPFADATQDPQGLVSLLRVAALDGVVLAPPSSDLEPVLDALDAIGMPYGRVAPRSFPGRGACATMDDVAAARAVAEHLLRLGHRSIGVIYGHRDHISSALRRQGYVEAFAAYGLDYLPVVEQPGDFTRESGVAAMQRIISGGIMPTAILAQNDDMAVGALMAAREAGISVPETLSIAGFDDSDVARLAWPTLTTVRQPVVDMARQATDGLLALMSGRGSVAPTTHEHVLCMRHSTAQPRHG
ncbi:MAG: LacI family DNA-binding transcriptional regulator [Sphingomonadales bacterium]|nr:LacI family DNA-binding transcriptional regulator [Sphingomonadales bacterium]MDE2169524.1 LacI family DNA-binding transcriptional regulator [Sphingomonadales bacterium]